MGVGDLEPESGEAAEVIVAVSTGGVMYCIPSAPLGACGDDQPFYTYTVRIQ